MTSQDNIQIVRHIFEAWNKHDADRYVKLLDEKHVVESDTLPAPLTGRDAGRQFMQMYVSAFPDLHFDIDQIFGEGDSALVARCSAMDAAMDAAMAPQDAGNTPSCRMRLPVSQ